MSNNKSIDRLAFLAEKFDVFENTKEGSKELFDGLVKEGYSVETIENHSGVIAYLSHKRPDDTRNFNHSYKVSVSFDVFNDMVMSDPSKNKMYTQWMLTTFQRYLKSEDRVEAVRFVDEDLPLAEDYLKLFEANKRKKKFKELSLKSFVLKGVKDPTNINQYKSLSQLYDAVDPFIDKDPSSIEKKMNEFVKQGKAVIPIRDRKFTVYIPKSKAATVIFDEFAGWCTVKKKGDMFNYYRTESKYLRANGQKSDIYIVIDNRFFDGDVKVEYLYQLHFESEQVMDRIQSKDSHKFFENIILNSDGVANFFHDELMNMAKMSKNKTNNVYINYLIKFGWTEALFDIMEDFTPLIRFVYRDVPRIPDVSRFKNLTTFIIKKAKLTEIHPSVCQLKTLRELLLPDNNITELPSSIGKLQNLVMLNLLGNKIKTIPDEIKYLDKTNGGKLHRIAINREEVGEANYRKLKQLLPSVNM